MNLKEQYEKLLRYCYMKTNDRLLAEDIVQEAYLRFWKGHHYEDTGKEMACEREYIWMRGHYFSILSYAGYC